eukprot:CAMPEP_0206474042 /NCGR_PEP_ID=MMETSP0324_2-20121206/33239_1 /ASSEMBLY_ACC=CAM_ASM_000836 /TAXON_ID=2866 /ORGANISM="Crypthecodinium cohnii, Strain Seligo" /LENGTH=511 /DNA_ID=CAMNT_0053949115 /DNA_START=153 /DNA_END=1685 /DNA_ORIENTATION=-
MFDLYDERWRDCWVAATSAVRSRKRQVDLNIAQRVERLLLEHGPDTERPLTLRIYGTMMKGFCVINNERARTLFSDCERVVLAFTRQPYSEGGGESKLRLPPAKRPRMEASLTLDLDLSKVEASEQFDWNQAPLEEGLLLRLGGAEGFDLYGNGLNQNRPPMLGMDLFGAAPGQQDGGWLPSNLDTPIPPQVMDLEQSHDHHLQFKPPSGLGEWCEAPPGAQEPSSQLVLADPNALPQEVLDMQPGVGQQEAAQPAPATPLVPQDLEALFTAQMARKKARKGFETILKPGVVYGFDSEPTISAANYDIWQQETTVLTRKRLRASNYAELLDVELPPPDCLAPLLADLLDASSGSVHYGTGRLFREASARPEFLPPDRRQQPDEALPAAPKTPDRHFEVPAPVDLEQYGIPLAPDQPMEGFVERQEIPEELALVGRGLEEQDVGVEAQDDSSAQVASIIRGTIKSSGRSNIFFDELVPPQAADRATAACTFATLLALASAGDFLVDQDGPFG